MECNPISLASARHPDMNLQNSPTEKLRGKLRIIVDECIHQRYPGVDFSKAPTSSEGESAIIYRSRLLTAVNGYVNRVQSGTAECTTEQIYVQVRSECEKALGLPIPARASADPSKEYRRTASSTRRSLK